jgi:hypothetical protein
MLRTPPHPVTAEWTADRAERLLARVRVALVALTAPHAAGLASASQVCTLRPRLPTGPTSSREATP